MRLFLAVVLIRELVTLQMVEGRTTRKESMMKITQRFLVAIVILAILTATTPSAPTPPTPKAASWEEILEWLPEDTETLFVTPKPFVIPTNKEKTVELTFAEVLPFLPSFGFGVADAEKTFEMAGVKCLCIVEGSRCFTRPKDLGLMPYQGAHIMQFDPASANSVRKAFETCLKKADKEIELMSHRVAVYTKKQESDKWTYYFAQPQPSVLICATHKGYLEETLKRLGTKPKKRALPADLPEWKLVDVKAAVWALRHYREEFAENDPTSPLTGKNGGKTGYDNNAIGLIFWCNPETSNIAQIRYLSDSKDAEKIALEAWSEGDLKPKIKRAEKGVVEITLDLSKDKASNFVLVLLLQLGHAILL